MAVPDGKFVLTQETMRETFARLNAELFGGQLATIPLKLSNAVKRGGTYRAKAEFVQQNPRMRRLLRDHRIENLRDESITISKKLCLTQETLDRFMAHEMVHQWQSGVMGVSEDRGGHGDLFHQKMEEINSVRGPGFVTVSSDVVAGETGGKEGQVYHVVIFERGGRKFGGFSRRPFGEKETGIIEQAARRMGAEYRVLTTTSHDAQLLLDISRMRPGTRRRSWAVIPADIHESIVSGETTVAALRRARLLVADLRGVTLYHGTSLASAVEIAREGVRSFSGDQWSGNPAIVNAGTDAIYLTPDLELAARYAKGLAGDRPPAILECRVSGRHMKKLRTDPMDTWEGAWDEDGNSYSELPEHQEELDRLRSDAEGFLGRNGVRVPYGGLFPDDFDRYDGLGLYRLALGYMRQAAPDGFREMFRGFRGEFPPGDHGFYHIRPDGTVRLDSSYWEAAHQLQYSKGNRPTRLPPAAIKATWIPAEMAPPGSETQEVRPRNLPCESKESFDEEAKAHESVPDWCDALAEAEDAEDIGLIRVNDLYIEDIGDDDPEPLLAVRQVAKEMLESPDEDHSQRIRELRDEYEGFYDPYDNWGGDTYCETVTLAKVPLDFLTRTAPLPDALRAAAMEIAASSGTMVAYHATLSGSDILEGGFKKSDEVERVGLGGSSTGGSVSFTTDWGVATGIHKSFEMMHGLVNADDPLAAIRGHLESLDPPLAESVKDYWKSADGGDLPELLSGWKPKPYGARMQTYDQLVQQGFKPVHAAGDEGGEGDTLYYQWLEPVTKEDAEKMVYTYVKVYFYANTDEYNPVFMGGDASHFKGIPRDDIGVFTVELNIDPSKKRKNHGELDRPPGYAILPAESEYRVSDMSMVGAVLDYDTHPGPSPKVPPDERSYHADPEVEAAVNGLLSLIERHRDLLERRKLDVRQAVAVLRDADDMRAVAAAAGSVLNVAGLRGAEATLRDIVDLSGRMRPSEIAGKAVAALPDSVREEVSGAPSSARFSDISERWYDRDEAGYTAWCDALLEMDIGESAAEREIDDWIYSHHFEDRLREAVVSARYWIPDFAQGDAEAYLELAEGLSDPARSKAAALKVALRTVYEAGDPSKARHFILRRGKLWLWGGIDLGGADEARLVESIREEFGTDQPPFDQKFPIDNQYRVRDMFEPSGLFGPSSDEDMTRFQDLASDTLHGMVLPDGTLRAKTVTGLPVHADHPEMEKLLKHLGAEAERPQPKGMWYHGFLLTPERAAGVGRFGLRPGEAVGESNWERNEEYDRSLVYLTTDEMNAKGHACGRSEGKYPYAAVVAVRAESLDRTRMEADFDAERAGFRPGRAGLVGYRGRIPVAAFDWVKIHRNGYNQDTTPLLLTLGSDEFGELAKEYAEWAERTKEDREALEKEQRHGPSFTDHRRVQELADKIETDPIRRAVDAAKADAPLAAAASLASARARLAAAGQYLYHCTLADSLLDIAREGLDPACGGANFPGGPGDPVGWVEGKLFLSDDPQRALYYGENAMSRLWAERKTPPVLLRIPRHAVEVQPDRHGDFYTEDIVQPSMIEANAPTGIEPDSPWDWEPLTEEMAEEARDIFSGDYLGRDEPLFLAPDFSPKASASDGHRVELTENDHGGVSAFVTGADGEQVDEAYGDMHMGSPDEFQGDEAERDHFHGDEPIEGDGPVAILTGIELPEDLRGAGLGRMMVEEMSRWAFARGAQAVYTHAVGSPGDPDPTGFYETLGFYDVGMDPLGNLYMKLDRPGGRQAGRKSPLRAGLEAAVEAAGMSDEIELTSGGGWVYLNRKHDTARMSKVFAAKAKKSHLWVTMFESPAPGQGAGRAFVAKLEEIARSAGIPLIKGEALHGSEGFWEAVGFEETGIRRTSPDDEFPYHKVQKVLACARLRLAGSYFDFGHGDDDEVDFWQCDGGRIRVLRAKGSDNHEDLFPHPDFTAHGRVVGDSGSAAFQPSASDREKRRAAEALVDRFPGVRFTVWDGSWAQKSTMTLQQFWQSLSRAASREPAFLGRLRDAGAVPPPETSSAAAAAVMSGTLIHNAAGSAGGDPEEKVRSILESGIDPGRWVRPGPGQGWSDHPKAAYLSLAWDGALENPPPNYVFAEPRLSKPLVLWCFDADGNYVWGGALREATGKSGQALSSLLRRHGYDSVVTVRQDGDVGEIAYFGESPLQAFLPEQADRTAHALAAAAEITRRAALGDIFRGVQTVIDKYGGKGLFARFSDVPKIGIRPSTEHHDPYGVYFYPVDWLAENAGWGTTYANLPYITVARIRRSGWLNLATVRPAKARELAEKGGVLEEYDARTSGKGLNQAKTGRAGKRLWDAVEDRVKPFESESNKMEWNRIFGRMGVKAIYDPGTGTVNDREPSQIVVLDLSLIEVVDMVENKEDRKSVFHAVLKAVADDVLDDGWRVAGSHAEGGIWAVGEVAGAPVELSVMPARGGFKVEVALSYHDPSGKKRRIVSKGEMPSEWEYASAAYLSEQHAKSINRGLADAELGPGGAEDAEDMLDAALRAFTSLRLPNLTVEEEAEGVSFWKNTGDGKIEGSLKASGDRRELELYAEDWLRFAGDDASIIEVGPMRISWEGDPSSAKAGMVAELSRAVRELRVTDGEGKLNEGIDRAAAEELLRMRTLSWMFPEDILDAAGLPKRRKTATAECPYGEYRTYTPSPGGVRMPPRITPKLHDDVQELFSGVCMCDRCQADAGGGPKVARAISAAVSRLGCRGTGGPRRAAQRPPTGLQGPLRAWHGTSDEYLPLIREGGGLDSPFLAATPELAEYYAEVAAEDDGGEPILIEVTVRDTSRLRYDGAAMDEPVTVGVDEGDRDAEWGRAEEEHPEWVHGGTISVPPEEWEYSWRGAHSVWHDGLVPLADLAGDIDDAPPPPPDPDPPGGPLSLPGFHRGPDGVWRSDAERGASAPLEMVESETPPQAAALTEMFGRSAAEFARWADEEGADRDSYWFALWLEESGVSVREDGLVEFDTHDAGTARLVGDLPVVVYHHTSDAVLPAVRREGLRPDTGADASRWGEPCLGVYVTTEAAGPPAEGYLSRACDVHGGNPVTLEVRTTLADLAPDENDADIASGARQFVLPSVPPRDVLGLGAAASARPVSGRPRFVTFDELRGMSRTPEARAALARAARALGEHLGDTVSAYRALGAEHMEKVIREGFTGEHHSRGVYYTANRERAMFYARFMPKGRWGVIFELEADTSRSTADVNDATEAQSDELFAEVREAAGDMVEAVRRNADVRLQDSDAARQVEAWLGALTVSEGFYDNIPEQHSVWQLIADETDMTPAEAREALPPGRYGEMTVLDGRGVAGIDAGEISDQAQAVSSAGVGPERLTAVWLPSDLLEAAGETAPAGAETMADWVDVIPAQLDPEDDLVAEIERQQVAALERSERPDPEGDAEGQQVMPWGDRRPLWGTAEEAEEVASALGGILSGWRDERDSTLSGHVYSKLMRGEEVTAADLGREERLVKYPLPGGRLAATKAVRKALAADAAGDAIGRAARRAAEQSEGVVGMGREDAIARALQRAAESVADWDEKSDVDPEGFEDEGFVEDESGHEFWGSKGSGCLFVRNHPDEGPQLLAVLRSPHVEEPNTWGTTGGAVPQGETNDFASAIRETREEVGSIPRYEGVKKYVWKATGGTFTYTTFILECLDMDWTPSAFNWEATDAKWVSLDEASGLDLHFGLSAILDDLGEGIFPAAE